MLTKTFFPAVARNPFRTRDAFAELQRIHEGINRFFDGRRNSGGYPALNAWSNEEEAIVRVELPGFAPEDIEITLAQNTLTLRGARKGEEPKEGEKYHRRERWNGRFTRSFELPFDVDKEQIDADFRNGLLTIKLPRAAEDRPKKIEVKAA